MKLSMCKCDDLPEYFTADTSDPYFKNFRQIDWKDDAWVKLIECPHCGQHWQLDEWDKYQNGLALKIQAPDKWKQYDDRPARIDFLIQNRGGISKELCAWQGCENNALNGLAYCPFCAYEKGGIRE